MSRLVEKCFLTVRKEVTDIKEKIPIMTYSQYRRARKLVHQCCNYDSGNCLALDDGEECVCAKHFLLSAVHVVPYRCPAFG